MYEYGCPVRRSPGLVFGFFLRFLFFSLPFSSLFPFLLVLRFSLSLVFIAIFIPCTSLSMFTYPLTLD